jgi:FMN reductase
MPRTLNIVGLGGSVASTSKSRAALQKALSGAEDAGARTQLLDIRVLELPIYNPEDDEPTRGAVELIESCHAQTGCCGAVRSTRGRSPAR